MEENSCTKMGDTVLLVGPQYFSKPQFISGFSNWLKHTSVLLGLDYVPGLRLNERNISMACFYYAYAAFNCLQIARCTLDKKIHTQSAFSDVFSLKKL